MNLIAKRPSPRGGGAVISIAAVMLATVAMLPRITRAEEPVTALVGLSELPEVDVERFPLGDPMPVPMPEIPAARLRIESLAGEVVLDAVPFDAQGAPIEEVFAEINRVFSARDGSEVAIHPRLVELLITLSRAFDDKPITLVSAHRRPGAGTSKKSYHVRGMAADVLIRGVKVHDLRKAAERLGATGIGVYSAFLHVDVRVDAPFKWTGGGWRRWRRK